MSTLDFTIGNQRELWLIVDSLNTKAKAKGYDGIGVATYDECMETLADEETGFAYLDDQEARLGLDVAEERLALTSLFQANGEEEQP